MKLVCMFVVEIVVSDFNANFLALVFWMQIQNMERTICCMLYFFVTLISLRFISQYFKQSDLL